MKRALLLMAAGSVLALSNVANAGTASITDVGAKNLGSSIAYIMQCEFGGHLPEGTGPNLLFAARDSFTPEAYEMVKRQYQNSLHDKKLYSIAKDRWFPFKIDADSCARLGEAIPSMISALRQTK